MGAPADTPSPDPGAPARRHARTALAVLVAVYAFNFLDRNLLSVLAERVRADLGVDDADLGFLYGTAFGVFFAVCGFPLARLADATDRRRLMAGCLVLWSAATCASAFAGSFAGLAAARVLVGVGEAGAAPAAYSLLADYFPRARRATALAIYNAGIYLGIGAALVMGGLVVQRWDAGFAGAAPLGLRGWQAAFLVAGLPGLLLAAAVLALREPERGVQDGVRAAPAPHPWRDFAGELLGVLPPFALLQLLLAGAARAAALNLAAAAALAGAAWAATAALGHAAQWIGLALGFYAFLCWGQRLAHRDAPAFAHIFRTPALTWTALGFAFHSLRGYGLLFWMAPYFVRVHGQSEAQVGTRLGLMNAVGGVTGVVLGGWLADAWRARDPRGRLWFSIAAAALPVAIAVPMLLAEDVTLAYALYAPFSLVVAMWMGAGGATVTDLVPPRLRATATAGYLFLITMIGLGLGPFVIGRLSEAFGSLRSAMLAALGAELIAVMCLALAARTLVRDEARAHG
jgi:MFS family permease